MALDEARIFIHRDLVDSEWGVDLLREYLGNAKVILNNTIIRGITEDALDVMPASEAQQRYSMTDTAFQYFVTQKADDGYIYATVESFKKILGV